LPILEQIPAKIKFVSAEPLLDRLDFRPYLGWLDWVITGCEQASKEKRRPMDLDWVRDISEQCEEYDVAHYFKQYYGVADGEEFGVPITDGILDGVHRQECPENYKKHAA
jgi:protein gp37